MTDSPAASRAAVTTRARGQVLDALLASSEPLDAAAIAQRLGLHVTTARFHLDQLVASGLAARRPDPVRRRGRPRILYLPAGPARDDDAKARLIGVLAGALAGDPAAAARSVDAGRRWADDFEAAEGQAPVPALIEALDRLGFAPEEHPGEIRLHACPFRDAARAHPEVVCEVHRGLIDGLVARSGVPADLVPFRGADLCLIAVDAGAR